MKNFCLFISLIVCLRSVYSLDCFVGSTYKFEKPSMKSMASTLGDIVNITAPEKQTCGNLMNTCATVRYNKTFPLIGGIMFMKGMCGNDAVACGSDCKQYAAGCNITCCNTDMCNKFPTKTSSASMAQSISTFVFIFATVLTMHLF